MTRRHLHLVTLRRIGALCSVGVVAVAIVLITRSPSEAPSPDGVQPRAGARHALCTGASDCRRANGPLFFSPDSIWNAPVPPNAPIDPNSEAIVSHLVHQEQEESVGIATTSYGVPIYTVGPSQPAVHIDLDQGPSQAALQDAFDAVPLPENARPAPGSDADLAVYQPSSDTMWEFWRLVKRTDGWHAQWGGRMVHVSSDPGYYRNVVDPSGKVLERPLWGAPATSFPLVAGVMTIKELQSGQIDHALCLAISHTRAGVWVWPAQRTDGDVRSSVEVPEGAHFRLDPKLDLGSLHLPRFVLMMARAAQTYGVIINNKSDGFTFRAEDPQQYEARHGYNPYLGRYNQPGTGGGLLDDWPSVMLREFPWTHLELLKGNLRTTPDVTPVTES